MPISYIDLVPPYVLLKIHASISGVEDISQPLSFAFGELYQVSAGSTLTIGRSYGISGDVKTLSVGGLPYYIVKEDNLIFIETAS